VNALKNLGYRLRTANDQLASKPGDDWMALAEVLRVDRPRLRGNVVVFPLLLCDGCQEMRPHEETPGGATATCQACGLVKHFTDKTSGVPL